MKYSYDLHIHSVLSPCADDLQTPNNIFNMCMLKGLDIVAITDHNSLKQLSVFDELKSSYNFLFIYGIEVTVYEDFHVLVYVDTIDKANILNEYLEPLLDKNKLETNQFICDIYDNPYSNYQISLSGKLNLKYMDLLALVRNLDGIMVISHIDRTLMINNNHYDIFKNIEFDAIEFTKYCNAEIFYNIYPIFKQYKCLINSDAHSLMDINESIHFVDLKDLSFESLSNYLRSKNE